MTNGEIIATTGVGLTIIVQASALVWGASKMSNKVDNAVEEFKGLRTDFKEFLVTYRHLELRVERHDADIHTLKGDTNA